MIIRVLTQIVTHADASSYQNGQDVLFPRSPILFSICGDIQFSNPLINPYLPVLAAPTLRFCSTFKASQLVFARGYSLQMISRGVAVDVCVCS